MALAAARYGINTGPTLTNANLNYNDDIKTTPLVTKDNTGSISRFRLLAPGWWHIALNTCVNGNTGLYLTDSSGAADLTANSVAALSLPSAAAYINLTCCREFSYNQDFWVWRTGSSGAMLGGSDLNWISFTFLGAI